MDNCGSKSDTQAGRRKPPSLRKEADLEGLLPSLLSNCSGSQITGIGVAQMLVATPCIHVNRPMLDDQEGTAQPKHRSQSVTVSRISLKVNSSATLHHHLIADPHLQASALALVCCLPMAHCPQNLTSVSGTSSLGTQDSGHSLPCSSLSSHAVIFYKLPAAEGKLVHLQRTI